MDKITDQEKERLIKEFDARQERQCKTGKIIVFIIATFNIIGSIISMFVRFNIITLIIQVVLSIALFRGVTWVRYFFAINAALGSLMAFYYLGVNNSAFNIMLAVTVVVYQVICSILLFVSKSVSEFLYMQKNG